MGMERRIRFEIINYGPPVIMSIVWLCHFRPNAPEIILNCQGCRVEANARFDIRSTDDMIKTIELWTGK
jgi:hypothetical protein